MNTWLRWSLWWGVPYWGGLCGGAYLIEVVSVVGCTLLRWSLYWGVPYWGGLCGGVYPIEMVSVVGCTLLRWSLCWGVPYWGGLCGEAYLIEEVPVGDGELVGVLLLHGVGEPGQMLRLLRAHLRLGSLRLCLMQRVQPRLDAVQLLMTALLQQPRRHLKHKSPHMFKGQGPRFTKILKSDRNRKHISGAKMRFTKIIIMVARVFERN